MKALVIVEVNITDPVTYEEYRSIVGPTIDKYGGRVISVTNEGDGRSEVLEGNWKPKHLVLVTFESVQQAKKWYDSPEYFDALEIRRKCSECNIIVVETF